MTLPPPWLTVGTTHCSVSRSPGFLCTYIRLLDPKISNFDSSDHMTVFYISRVQSLYWNAQANLFFLFLALSNGFLIAILPWRPASCKRLLTVVTDNFLCRLILALAVISTDVNHLFLLLISVMNLSSLADVVYSLQVMFLPFSLVHETQRFLENSTFYRSEPTSILRQVEHKLLNVFLMIFTKF